MNRKIPSKIYFFFLIGLFCNSCEEEKIKLRASDMTRVDSLYKKEAKLVKIMEDSLCDLKRKNELQAVVDSIMNERLEERKKKLGF